MSYIYVVILTIDSRSAPLTNDYIKGKAGFYMTLEDFSNFRKCERMIAKIKFPVPFHLLNHIIIPINVRESHWFPAHMDVKF